jgi:hypothetical protein
MKKYAVGVFNLFDNKLIIEIVEASCWQDAIQLHTKTPFVAEELSTFATMEDAKLEAFNRDGMFDVVEIS